jgi:hypothetical protein
VLVFPLGKGIAAQHQQQDEEDALFHTNKIRFLPSL